MTLQIVWYNRVLRSESLSRRSPGLELIYVKLVRLGGVGLFDSFHLVIALSSINTEDGELGTLFTYLFGNTRSLHR